MIDGKVVLDGGRFATIDEEAFVREVQERALALLEAHGTFRLIEGRRFTPFQYDGAPRPAAAARPPRAGENGRRPGWGRPGGRPGSLAAGRRKPDEAGAPTTLEPAAP